MESLLNVVRGTEPEYLVCKVQEGFRPVCTCVQIYLVAMFSFELIRQEMGHVGVENTDAIPVL